MAQQLVDVGLFAGGIPLSLPPRCKLVARPDHASVTQMSRDFYIVGAEPIGPSRYEKP